MSLKNSNIDNNFYMLILMFGPVAVWPEGGGGGGGGGGGRASGQTGAPKCREGAKLNDGS